ncbi:hypothetical protein NMG60_11001390, partial [Bertholletia excelsa]
MELYWSPVAWLLIIVIPLTHLLLHQRRDSGHRRLPPGPRGWPVVGHMFHLGPMPHRTLAGLRERYGPVVWLRLGSINTMAILSADAAAEFFKHHDVSFIERNINHLMLSHGYKDGSIALAPYGACWRVMRRICTVEMLVAKRINATAHIRQRCVDRMLSSVEKRAEGSANVAARGVHVADIVFFTAFNTLGNLILSKDLLDPESNQGSEFLRAVTGLMEWSGHPNIVDLFPWLAWVDPQGLRRKMDRDLGRAVEIASGFVKERVRERELGGERKANDFLDVLLDYEGTGNDEPAKISDHRLNILILEIFLAGTETASSTIEWAMTELLCNPETMAAAQEELDRVVGSTRKMEESDIENLPYLQAVVKETLRLHPPIPLLVPRKAVQDTTFMGYDIPKDTQVFVNAWGIGRDPDCWPDPSVFRPERFMGSNAGGIEFGGQQYQFLPFGAGRRICAGIPLARRILHIVLGSLIHKFEWELESGVTRAMVDWRERIGLTVRRWSRSRQFRRRG